MISLSDALCRHNIVLLQLLRTRAIIRSRYDAYANCDGSNFRYLIISLPLRDRPGASANYAPMPVAAADTSALRSVVSIDVAARLRGMWG